MTSQPVMDSANQAVVVLTAPDGARAEIHRHGAHVTSWIPAGGVERLFLSRASAFGGDAAIRGGVPVCFPQFSGEGPLALKHGFARRMEWNWLKSETRREKAAALFSLHSSPASLALWPHAFLAELQVTVGGQQMEMVLTISNIDNKPLTFTGALHTYFLGSLGIAVMKPYMGGPYPNKR